MLDGNDLNTLTDWRIEWEAAYSSTGHWVEIWDGAGPCDFIPKGQPNPKVFRPGDPGVAFATWRAGGVFHHRLIVTGVNCVPQCSLNYKVHSDSGPRPSASTMKVLQISVCGQIQE